MIPLIPGLWSLLLAYNLFVFSLYAWDKLAARRGWWRTPEAHLLKMAFLFGSLGALAGIYLLRHKIRKPRFAQGVPVAMLLHVGALTYLYMQGWLNGPP